MEAVGEPLPEPDEERLRTAVARSSAFLRRQILLYVNDGGIPRPDRREEAEDYS